MKTRVPAVALVLLLARAAAAAEGTPVVLTANADCAVYVDGELAHAALKANTTHKILLVPGEHLVTAECVGRSPWKQVVAVGKDQKVVQIDAAAAAAPAAAQGAAAAPAPKGSTLTGVGKVGDRWIVGAVVKDSPAYKAGVRAGVIVLTVDGKQAKDLSLQAVEAMDAGPVGSRVTATILDREDRVREVAFERAAAPAAGAVEILLTDAKTVKELPFSGDWWAVATSGGEPASKPATGSAVTGAWVPGQTLGSVGTCLKCGKKPKYGGSMYCVDHKCNNPTCLAQEAPGGNYCPAHKCTEMFCQNEKMLGFEKCAAHHKWF